MTWVRCAVVVVLATVAVGPGSVLAFDLTGTWTGGTTCTSFFTGAKVKFKDAPTVAVTQSGDALGLRADFGAGNVVFYVGRAHPDAKKPDDKGEVALIACGTDDVAGNDPDFDELGRLAAAAKLGHVKATLKGISIFSDPGVAEPEAGTCKWKLTRTDSADASIPTECSSPPSARTAPAGTARTRRHVLPNAP